MKRVIIASNIDELNRELRYVTPIINKISSQYSEITGFQPDCRKYLMVSDNLFLVAFDQYYCKGITKLLDYKSMNDRYSLRNCGAMLDGSNVSNIVERMVRKLVACIDDTFNSPYTIYYERRTSEDANQAVIDLIISGAKCVDEGKARQFISELLDSGQIVNRVEELAWEDIENDPKAADAYRKFLEI